MLCCINSCYLDWPGCCGGVVKQEILCLESSFKCFKTIDEGDIDDAKRCRRIPKL